MRPPTYAERIETPIKHDTIRFDGVNVFFAIAELLQIAGYKRENFTFRHLIPDEQGIDCSYYARKTNSADNYYLPPNFIVGYPQRVSDALKAIEFKTGISPWDIGDGRVSWAYSEWGSWGTFKENIDRDNSN